jgi:GT2 family glycosyltransferase
VIVDNHSPRHPQVHRLRRREGVSLRRWSKNRGFAAAVNEGCRLAVGDWFLLMNPDTTPPDGFLDDVAQRVEALERTQPRAGIVGFHLRNEDGTQQLSSGPFPTLTGTLARLLLPRRRRKYQQVGASAACEVPWVTGCCLLVRRQCWDELQGLDESFFLYYEDVDLCRRARAKGWTVWYEPTLAVVHHHPLHSRPVPAALRLVLRHSLLTYARRHWPAWQFRLLSRIVRAENWARRVTAWWRNDHHDARIHRELGFVIDELTSGDPQAARHRLERVVHRKDLRVGV